jgi:uncharacterized protein (TIGR02466 family)
VSAASQPSAASTASTSSSASSASPELQPLFAVPFATTRLADCAALNTELESLFLARETDDWRNPVPTHRPQRELFESAFDLFAWREPCVARLRDFVFDAVGRVAAAAAGVPLQRFAGLRLHHHAWFHVTRRGGSFVAHNHPMASWSAVYCVRAGEAPADRPESGLLRFLDPRGGAGAFVDAANAALRSPWRVGAHDVRLEAGQLVVFPAYLVHEVTPFHGSDTRITVAANCWFA